MKIGVVGGGSIGLLVSSYLAEEHSITIYVRRYAQKETINTFGVFRNGMKHKKNIQAMLLHEMGHEDAYIICVKQPHIQHVLPVIGDVAGKKPVLFLQNGMGHLEEAGSYPIYVGTVEHGVVKTDDCNIKHTGKGLIKMASYSGDDDMLSYLVDAMDRNGFPVDTIGEWEPLLKEKLVVNAVINPLTVLFNIQNGYILKIPHIEALAHSLCKEASSVLEINHQKAWENVRRVAFNTSENISSMLNDIRNHQETEIEAITGYILRNGNKEIPNTAFIYHAIKAIEDLFHRTEDAFLNLPRNYYKQ